MVVVYSGEKVLSSTLYTDEAQEIRHSGLAKYTTINGGSQYVEGVAFSTIVNSGGVQDVDNLAIYTTINYGGRQYVDPLGSAFSTVVNSGGKQFLDAGDASNTIINGGTQIADGGTVISTTINNGGKQYITGIGSYTVINSGGVQHAENAMLTSTTINGGTQYIHSSILTFISKTTINSGGRQYVATSLSIHDTTINPGGRQDICSGGAVAFTQVNSGGVQVISSGGSADFTIVYAHGSQIVESGGSSIYTSIFRDSVMIVKDGGYAFGTALLEGDGIISSGGETSGLTVSSGGCQYVESGGLLQSVTVKKGGELTISSGGMAKGILVSKGGVVTVRRGGKASGLTLAKGGEARLTGGTLTGTTRLKGKSMLTVTAAGATAGKIKAARTATICYDLNTVKPGAADAMITARKKQAVNANFTIGLYEKQKTGTYKLSSNLTVGSGKAFTIESVTKVLGKATLNGTALKKDGVRYEIAQAGNDVTLRLSAVAGKMKTGNAKNNALRGTKLCDIFYGGKGNDTIYGKNGRDVAVYDRHAWGKDTIAATKGTMTIVLAGLEKSQVTSTLVNGTMTIRRNGTRQKITIKGWDAMTHDIVYGAKLTAFNKYLQAASPTGSQKRSARNEVWQKAGLASA